MKKTDLRNTISLLALQKVFLLFCLDHFVSYLLPNSNKNICKNCYIFTDHKRGLGQGHVFTAVCHFVHRSEGWFPSTDERSRDQGVLHAEGLHKKGLHKGVSTYRRGMGRPQPRSASEWAVRQTPHPRIYIGY